VSKIGDPFANARENFTGKVEPPLKTLIGFVDEIGSCVLPIPRVHAGQSAQSNERWQFAEASWSS